jgi:hypothetical protein
MRNACWACAVPFLSPRAILASDNEWPEQFVALFNGRDLRGWKRPRGNLPARPCFRLTNLSKAQSMANQSTLEYASVQDRTAAGRAALGLDCMHSDSLRLGYPAAQRIEMKRLGLTISFARYPIDVTFVSETKSVQTAQIARLSRSPLLCARRWGLCARRWYGKTRVCARRPRRFGVGGRCLRAHKTDLVVWVT